MKQYQKEDIKEIVIEKYDSDFFAKFDKKTNGLKVKKHKCEYIDIENFYEIEINFNDDSWWKIEIVTVDELLKLVQNNTNPKIMMERMVVLNDIDHKNIKEFIYNALEKDEFYKMFKQISKASDLFKVEKVTGELVEVRLKGYHWAELLEIFSIEYDEEIEDDDLEKLKGYLKNKLEVNDIVFEGRILRIFLKLLYQNSKGYDYCTEIWKGIYSANDLYTIVNYSIPILDGMWY